MPTVPQAEFAKCSPQGPERGKAEAARSIKILIVDGHFLIREALHSVLKEMKHHVIAMDAVDGQKAMQLISEHADIGLILLELNLPDRDGFSVLREIRERRPATSVVVYSARRDRESVTKALDLGAAGFIPKSGQREIMLRALQLVFAGGTYIPPEILTPEDSSSPEPRQTSAVSGIRQGDLDLTERQVHVLDLMMQGKSNKAICRALNLAEPTIKRHVTVILRALKVANRTEAVIAVQDLGWESPSASPDVLEGSGKSIASKTQTRRP